MLVPALEKYGTDFAQTLTPEISYQLVSTCALLWTSQMRDTASSVTEFAAAGAALIINHSTHEIRAKYFPLLEAASKKGEAQPLRYVKMYDRLLVENGKEQRFGTQCKFEDTTRVPYPIKEPEYVDKRRAAIGPGPLSIYLKERFDIDWYVKQKQ